MKRSVINANIEWAMRRTFCKLINFPDSGFLLLDTGRVGSKKRSD